MLYYLSHHYRTKRIENAGDVITTARDTSTLQWRSTPCGAYLVNSNTEHTLSTGVVIIVHLLRDFERWEARNREADGHFFQSSYSNRKCMPFFNRFLIRSICVSVTTKKRVLFWGKLHQNDGKLCSQHSIGHLMRAHYMHYTSSGRRQTRSSNRTAN